MPDQYPQPNEPVIEEVKPKTNWLTILISVIFTALVIGSGVYALQKITNDKKMEDLENQIKSLQDQLGQKTDNGQLDTEKQNNISDWQTYRNEAYGYEIKYPKDWFVYDNICNCDCENSVNSQTKSYDNVRLQSFPWPNKECGYSGLGGQGVRLTIYINTKLKNLDEWVNNTKNSDPSMKVNIEKDISLAGIIGKELTLSCDCLTGVDFYRIIEKDNKLYEFSISSQDVNLNNYSSTIDQILSTFKFTDPTTGWQTYSNSTLGFSIQYPSEWKNAIKFSTVGQEQVHFKLPAYRNSENKELGVMDGEALCIGRMSVGDWVIEYDKLLNHERPSLGTELVRDGEYVFYTCPQYEAFSFTVSPSPYDVDLISTFKLLKSNACMTAGEACSFFSQGFGGGDNCCVRLKCDGSDPDGTTGKCINE